MTAVAPRTDWGWQGQTGALPKGVAARLNPKPGPRLVDRQAAAGAAFSLRPYQVETIDAILAARDRGVRRQLAVLPTGAGKTEVFTQLVFRIGGRALIVAHRDELIDQAADKVWRRAPAGTSVGIVKAERNEVLSKVIIASIQTLSRPKRRAHLPRDIRTVIIDEAHHAAASSYRDLLEHLGCFGDAGPFLVGFTATPDRADGRTVGDTVFQEQTVTIGMLDLIEAGYLCDIRAIQVSIDASLESVHTTAGDFRADELASVLMDAHAPDRIAQAYLDYAPDRKAVVFTPTVAMAYEIAAAMRCAGIAAEAADGTSHRTQRRAVLERFSAGETQVVVNCGLWTEGFDEPSVSCIILCRPTKSRALYTQMIGRGTRLFPGKTDCLILDLVGQAGRHDIASVPNVFGLPATGAMSIPSIKQAARQRQLELEQEMIERTRLAERARLVSRTVDLFRTGTPSWPALHWVPVQTAERMLMVLDTGEGLIKVGAIDDVRWAVVLNTPAGAGKVLVSNVSQAEAQRIAEEYARRHGRPGIVYGRAWRSGPVSQKVRGWARVHGITLPPSCTAGEASDAILTYHAIHGY